MPFNRNTSDLYRTAVGATVGFLGAAVAVPWAVKTVSPTLAKSGLYKFFYSSGITTGPKSARSGLIRQLAPAITAATGAVLGAQATREGCG